MNLSLTKRGDYAVRAAISLARIPSDRIYRKIREVAEDMAIPIRYTPQILRLLSTAGLAEARAGRDGGYRLLRNPDEISLLEVVEAADGPLQPSGCTLRGGPCHWDDMCAVHPAWEEATRALRDTLGAVSLQEVADVDAGLESGKLTASQTAHRRQRQRS